MAGDTPVPRRKSWRMFLMPPLEADRLRTRTAVVERDVVLPVKLLVLLYVFFSVFYSEWFHNPQILREFIQDILKWFFVLYILFNVVAGRILLEALRVPMRLLRATVSAVCLLDSLMVAGLAFITGGFDSTVYWLFPALIVRNAISMPETGRQALLQVGTNLSFVLAGVLDIWVSRSDYSLLPGDTQQTLNLGLPENPAEPFLLRLVLLALLSVCCYGLQVLLERQRLVEEEGQEFALRSEQVRTAGRLAAEIAHQIKNPLAIINNTAWSLQRSLRDRNGTVAEQLQIIREEVERSDRIITEIMGYARLAEGRVERLEITEELDAAVEKVLPPGAGFNIRVERDYHANLPSLLMQRGHLQDIIVNLLQNAREAMPEGGVIRLQAEPDTDRSIRVEVSDTGPGIPADKREQIFEAYYTTRVKGTGLGLAIVRNNVDLYGGSVRAESELGKGARFILRLPARTTAKVGA